MNEVFNDEKHSADAVSVSRVNEKDIEPTLDETILAALAEWMVRADKTSDDASPFTSLGLSAFCISYTGVIIQYTPDEDSNRSSEALVRDFLFTDGICNLDSQAPRLFEVESRMQVLEATDLLLVLPFETVAGNIAGTLVVDVGRHRHRHP